MNRAIPIVCLVGLIFAVGALANDSIVSSERAALAKESAILDGIANDFVNDNTSHSEAKMQWNPTIIHLIRSIERTRRLIISEALEHSQESATFKRDLVNAHYRAYEAVDMKMVELSKALTSLKSSNHVANKIEELLRLRVKQAESY